MVRLAQILRVGSEHFAKGGVGAHVPAARNVAVESKAVRYVFHLREKNRKARSNGAREGHVLMILRCADRPYREWTDESKEETLRRSRQLRRFGPLQDS